MKMAAENPHQQPEPVPDRIPLEEAVDVRAPAGR
jgi:hypothetical protein